MSPLCFFLDESRVQYISEAVAQQVEDDNVENDGHAGIKDQLRRGLHELAAFAEHIAPLRRGRLGGQTQEGQAAEGQQLGADVLGDEHQQVGEHVGQDQPGDDLDLVHAGHASLLHIGVLLQA